ncbi:MAG: hypothetical protein NXI31_09795 [bacterium]|nr:hypothetical protein [bacterium]
MKNLLRILAVALAAVWLAAPSVGGEGGENAGGTGVWILPACAPVGSPGVRSSFAVNTLASDITMTMSPQIGNAVATAVDPRSGAVLPLSVRGRDVVITAEQLGGFRQAGVTVVDILISDDSRQGYHIRLDIHPTAGATFTAF